MLYHDYWAVRGLRDAGRAARSLGETADSDAFAAAEQALLESLDPAVDAAFAEGYVQAAPGATGSWDWGSIAAVYPCEALDPLDDRMTSTFEFMWNNRALDEYRFPDKDKIWTYITADWARALLARGEWERAWTLFQGYRKQSSAVLGWWEEVFTTTGAGTGDDPHGWAAANFVLWVRSLLVRETDDAIELLGGVPPEWRVAGAPLRAEGLPLRRGLLRSLSVDTAADGRATVAWDISPRDASGTAVRFFLRGIVPGSVDCGDLPFEVSGDSVRVEAAAGSCAVLPAAER